jgi:hypothetical protein
MLDAAVAKAPCVLASGDYLRIDEPCFGEERTKNAAPWKRARVFKRPKRRDGGVWKASEEKKVISSTKSGAYNAVVSSWME